MVLYWKIFGSELDDPSVSKAVKEATGIPYVQPHEVEELKKTIKYPEFLAAVSPDEDGKYHNEGNPNHARDDKGHLGSPNYENLFKGQNIKKFDLSPNLGTEIGGVQLSELDDAGKNDLALFLETRGLAIFRGQDLKEKGPQFSVDFGRYFGPLHIHPVSLIGDGHPEVYVTLRKAGDGSRFANEFRSKTGEFAWHSDVSFEPFPPSFSFFVALEAPSSGGDTVFIDLREAYKRLSPSLQNFFETLTVIHLNYYQNKNAAIRNVKGRVKGDVFTEHPLVRTHPVTGEKSLFFSRIFIQKIKGLKKSESDAILNFLEDHVCGNPEFQVRAAHRGSDSGTVIAWDNRFLIHTATADY